MQTSSELNLIELIVLGFEFCGSYALSPGSTFGSVRREPHSTVPKLLAAVENDSDLFNTGSERIANDSKRRNALLFMGYTEVTITRKQIYNFSELDKAARR